MPFRVLGQTTRTQSIIDTFPSSGSQFQRPPVDLTNQVVRDSAVHVANGAFGDVFRCRRNTPGTSSLVVVKTVRYFACDNSEEAQRKLYLKNKDLRRELDLLRRLDHSNIVSLLGVTHDFGPMIAAVLPWIPNGTPHSFVKNKGLALTMVEWLKLVKRWDTGSALIKSAVGSQLQGIGVGLEYLHPIPVFHGDLYSGNVLIDEDHNPRISNLGLAYTIGKLQPGLSYLPQQD